jgi:hypothetical protein
MWATRAKHFNVGLPQGFVKFGSAAHRILYYLHESGEGTQTNLIEELDLPAYMVSNCLQRLLKYKYIRRAGKLDGYRFNCVTQSVYVLAGAHGVLFKCYESRRKTSAERMRKHRASKKTTIPAVPSIFAYAESLV